MNKEQVAETVRRVLVGIEKTAPQAHKKTWMQAALIGAQNEGLLADSHANRISDEFNLGLHWSWDDDPKLTEI